MLTRLRHGLLAPLARATARREAPDDVRRDHGAARGAGASPRDYLGRQPLHLQGPPDKFQAVMSWDVLNRLLGMTTVWTDQTMLLILDKETVPRGQLRHAAPRAATAAPCCGRTRRGCSSILARGATHGPELHRPADARSSRPSPGRWRRRWAGGPGQPLSLLQAQAGLQGALRLP